MSKLHQVLAVEADLEKKYKAILEETKKVFGKAGMFVGFNRRLEMFNEADAHKTPEENQEVTTTVRKRLLYTTKPIVAYLDALFQKEKTNQTAVASVIVDDVVLMENVPATFLLGLEKRLKYIRQVYEEMPTLQAGIKWEKAPDKGENIWEMVFPEEKLKTEMTYKSQVIVQPTEHHPAQVEKWQEQVPVGKYVKNIWSGMVTSSEKAEILDRIDKVIVAVKSARQQANSATASNEKVASKLMDFING